MQQKQDGSTYAPKGQARAVCAPGEFPVGVVGLDHGHIYGMCNGLTEAGANIALVFDPDPEKVQKFLEAFPQAKAAASRQEVMDSPVKMIATAAIASHRAEIGIEAMRAGKDFFSDKPALTRDDQLVRVRKAIEETGRKFFVYFSERLHVEAMTLAEQLLSEGKIGRVVQVMGWGPHRESPQVRPAWFYDPAQYGGILVDIGCHQIEQILFMAGARRGTITQSRIGNYNHSNHPAFEDFGDATIQCDNGVTGYFRVDWFTPDGLGAWGDGRLLVIGTKGYLEIRKYIDIANSAEGDQVYYVDQEGEHHIQAAGRYGFPFFGKMVRDCLDRTQNAMDQDYILHVMELALDAQQHASRVYVQSTQVESENE
ncbi:MAG: Gfo/Idh/MocA family protein [Candidatus Ventricola sp.]